MGQTSPPQWWEIIVGILSIPATLFGIISSFYVVQKATLEKEKLRLETRKLELEVLEKEKKLRSKGKISEKPKRDGKFRSTTEKVLLDIQSVENGITNFLMELLKPFRTYEQDKSTTSIRIQRVVGSLVELLLLLLFLYADLVQSVNTLVYIFPADVPPFLRNLVLPLVISSAGTSMVLGVIMGDLLEITNFTSWADLRERRKPFLPIILFTLILSILFSVVLSLSRLDIIQVQNSSPIFSAITSLADGLFIIPTLITTSFLFNGTQGILVLLALPIFILRLPITILRKVVARIVYYVSD
jgi:hypothetical protein